MIKQGVGLKGEYQFTVLNADRSLKHQTAWMDNLILNSGLDYIGGRNARWTQFCRVGTGTSTPVNTNTQLDAQIASSSNTVTLAGVNAGAPNYQTQATQVVEFALGAVVGNVTEVGMGWASTGATLFSRALTVNGSQVPTAFTVLSSEILQVTYRLSAYPIIADQTAAVTISGTSYTFTARRFSIQTTLFESIILGRDFSIFDSPRTFSLGQGSLVANTANSTFSALPFDVTDKLFSAYTAGNYYLDCTLKATLSQANYAGGITLIRLDQYIYNTQISVSPGLTKDATKSLTLVLRFSFGRYP